MGENKTQISAAFRGVRVDLFTLKIATGHFARLRFDRNLSIFAEATGSSQQNNEIDLWSFFLQKPRNTVFLPK